MKRSIALCVVLLLLYTKAQDDAKPGKKSWRDKDIRDMTDADLEHLLDEWEKNDEPLEPDELPEHLRPAPKIDISQLDTSNPDNMLKMTKKGKSVMMFVDTNDEMSPEDADVIMRIWLTSLQNNHIIAERFPIEPRRSIFMFREGSQAVDAKNYLLEQPELSHIMVEGQTYYRDAQKQKDAAAKIEKLRKDQVVNNKKNRQSRNEL